MTDLLQGLLGTLVHELLSLFDYLLGLVLSFAINGVIVNVIKLSVGRSVDSNIHSWLPWLLLLDLDRISFIVVFSMER